MLHIIGYIVFVLITVISFIGSAVLGTIAGIKENETTKEHE